MVPQVLYRVCYGTPFPTPSQVSHLSFQPAVLPGYVRRKVRGRDYPGITPAVAPMFVRGTYVHGLTDGDMWRLGIFEGSEYERRQVKVRLLTQAGVDGEAPAKEDILDLLEKCVEGEEEVETDTYVYIAGDARLEEVEWNFAEFKRDKMRRWAGVDEHEEYEEVDEAAAEVGENPAAKDGPKPVLTARQLNSESVEQMVRGAV